MYNMKILSPVGNFDSLKMAIVNGANEVYLGINDFNARNNIDGFTLSTLKDAVDYAHIFDVKVLLAINILFNNAELQNALNIVVDAYNMGVDAFIVQDLGLASLIHTHYPFIELHASTQMGLHNLEGVKAILPFGFKRVVLARETPLAEIQRIKNNTNVEIEYFAQGALCVSFSGNCYLSSYLNNASGNRGKCKQLCRLPYKFYNGNSLVKKGYLLSAKDFNMLNKLNLLKNAGVDVLKIEGRARRPYYVAMATREYYNALNNKKVSLNNISLAFNRDYTPGYLNGNNNIISAYNNHIGIYVGKVLHFNKGKKFNEIYILSNNKLSSKSTFKFLHGDKQITLTAYDIVKTAKDIYKITTTQVVQENSTVHLITDAVHEAQVLSQTPKLKVNIKITAKINNPIVATITLNKTKLKVLGDICAPANNQPVLQNDIITNFSKSDIFKSIIKFDILENIFLTKQQLNNFRRKVFNNIYSNLTEKYYKNAKKITININKAVKKFDNFAIINHLTDNISATNIIYSPQEYNLQDITKFINLCNKHNVNPYLDTPNFALKEDIDLLSDIINKTKIPIIANNYYALTFDTNIIIGAGLNVYNNISANIFNRPIITAESDISTRLNFAYMTLRHCPLKEHLSADCSNCPYHNNFTYKMQSGKTLKLSRKKLSSCTFYLTD